MAYDILSDDLFDDSDSAGPQRKKRPSVRRAQAQDDSNFNDGGSFISNHPVVFNLLMFAVLMVLLLSIYYVFFAEDNEVKEQDIVTFIGDLNYFNEEYYGTLEFSSNKFLLETQNGNFNEENKEVKIENFNGSILYENESIIITGKGTNIEYGNNLIKLSGTEFKLSSNKKTKLKLYFDNINVTFGDGRVKINEKLNFEFDDASIQATHFNSSLSFDGKVSLSGTLDSFNLNAPNDNLNLVYNNE